MPDTAASLYDFLRRAIDQKTPVRYRDIFGHDHYGYVPSLVRVDDFKFQDPASGEVREEPAIAITFVESTPEVFEPSPTGARALYIFLAQAADSVTPIIYTDQNAKKHRVYISRMVRRDKFRFYEPGSGKEREEPIIELVFQDAWSGEWIQVSVTEKYTTSITVTLIDPVTTPFKWQPATPAANWGERSWV